MLLGFFQQLRLLLLTPGLDDCRKPLPELPLLIRRLLVIQYVIGR